MTGDRVRVRARPDGRWQWVYETDGFKLESNDSFATSERAVDAAAGAYPHVTPSVEAPSDAREPDFDRKELALRLVAALLLGAAGVMLLKRLTGDR